MDGLLKRSSEFLNKHSADIFQEDKELVASLLHFLSSYRFEPNIDQHYSTCAFQILKNGKFQSNDDCFCFFINQKILILKNLINKYELLFRRVTNKKT
jgi:hypothetical protein